MPQLSDFKMLLLAIGRKETSGGVNNCPRFEPAYIPKGMAFTVQGHLITGTGTLVNDIVKERWDKYGLASAASYGPWQILYHTAADMGFHDAPWVLWAPEESQPWVEKQLRRLFIKGATTVEAMARGWNGGNPRANVPAGYIEGVKKHFAELGGDPNAPLKP